MDKNQKYKFSIIVPVCNEADIINALIKHINELRINESYEVIVVDGCPSNDTLQAIENKDVVKINAPKGRSSQMNAGAAIARGGILLFLHADTFLPINALRKISLVMSSNTYYVAGAFNLGIRSKNIFLKMIASFASLRSRITRIPYGDQVIFIRNEYFRKIGGFKEIPIMEDIDLMRRIKARDDRIYIISDRVSTSPRRWEQDGIIFTTIRNWLLLLLYHLRVSPNKLSKLFKGANYERDKNPPKEKE